jgi:hypothetical protein
MVSYIVCISPDPYTNAYKNAYISMSPSNISHRHPLPRGMTTLFVVDRLSELQWLVEDRDHLKEDSHTEYLMKNGGSLIMLVGHASASFPAKCGRYVTVRYIGRDHLFTLNLVSDEYLGKQIYHRNPVTRDALHVLEKSGIVMTDDVIASTLEIVSL